MIIKVRATNEEPKDDPRFAITNMKQSPQWIYERAYCQRGRIEKGIKELHDLEIDRTSCSSFWANQFRVLLTAAAYVLMQMQELRLRAAGARVLVGSTRRRPPADVLPVLTSFPSLWLWPSTSPPANLRSYELDRYQHRQRSRHSRLSFLQIGLSGSRNSAILSRDRFHSPNYRASYPNLHRPLSFAKTLMNNAGWG